MYRYLCIFALFGGLSSQYTMEESFSWLSHWLWDSWAPQPIDHYFKGETFSGLLFLKFQNEAARNTALKVLKKKLPAGDGVWAKPEKPLEQRVALSALYGAKFMLHQWRWVKAAMWVDEDTGVLTLGDDEVMSVNVKEQHLTVTYGEGWETYLQSDDWAAILNNAHDKLAQKKNSGEINGDMKGKGKAKGGTKGATK